MNNHKSEANLSFKIHSFLSNNLLLTEHILLLMIFQVVTGPLHIQEH